MPRGENLFIVYSMALSVTDTV